MADQRFYDQVAMELQNRVLVAGLWARAFAESSGENERAKALYIRFRVEQLSAEKAQEEAKPKQEKDPVYENIPVKKVPRLLVLFFYALIATILSFIIMGVFVDLQQ